MKFGEDGGVSSFPDSGKCELISGPLLLMESFTSSR